MTSPVSPSVGLGVLHLFGRLNADVDRAGIAEAVESSRAGGDQVICVSILGHKADIAFMVLSEDLWRLRDLQSALGRAGLDIVDSYVSLTEISEYAAGVPEEMRNMRLYPQLPPDDKRAWCFYPMSKRRNVDQNWFTLDFDSRKELMYEHGASGRKFSGRVLQVITGSTGIDDYEWGVTLFCVNPDDLKDVVYTMRFDEASATYAEFGPFYTGMVDDLDVVLERSGLCS
ncbi:MAG: chlorite dismutase family protein [Acidimicrobiales bacterium]